MDLKETYNKIARDWYKDHNDDDWWIEGTDKFAAMLQKGSEVLDVGCGAGVKARYLTSKGLSVTAIDFSENLIEIAKETVPGVEFQVLDMREVERLNKKFEAVFAQASLLHIPKKEIKSVIEKLLSVLMPGGYLYIAVKGIRDDGKEESILKENDYGYEYERFFSYFSMAELESYLHDYNLEVVYQNDSLVGRTHWLQIIGKK